MKMTKGHSVLLLTLCSLSIDIFQAAPQYRYKPQWRYDEIEFHYNNPSPYKTGVFDPFNINQDFGHRIEPIHYKPAEARIAENNDLNEVGHDLEANNALPVPSHNDHILVVDAEAPVSDYLGDSHQVHASRESISSLDSEVVNNPTILAREEPFAFFPAAVFPNRIPSSSADSDLPLEQENTQNSEAEDATIIANDEAEVEAQKDNQEVPVEEIQKVNDDFEEKIEPSGNIPFPSLDDSQKEHEIKHVIKSSSFNDVEIAAEVVDAHHDVISDNTEASVTDPEARNNEEAQEETTARTAFIIKNEVPINAGPILEDDVQYSGSGPVDAVLKSFETEINHIDDLLRSQFDPLNDDTAENTERVFEDATSQPESTISFRDSFGMGSPIESDTEEPTSEAIPLGREGPTEESEFISINTANIVAEDATESV